MSISEGIETTISPGEQALLDLYFGVHQFDPISQDYDQTEFPTFLNPEDDEVNGVAEEFILGGNRHRNYLGNIFVKYNGPGAPEEPYWIIDENISRYVRVSESTGRNLILPIRTSTFIGGVMHSLIEKGELKKDNWPQEKVLFLVSRISSILGRRQSLVPFEVPEIELNQPEAESHP